MEPSPHAPGHEPDVESVIREAEMVLARGREILEQSLLDRGRGPGRVVSRREDQAHRGPHAAVRRSVRAHG